MIMKTLLLLCTIGLAAACASSGKSSKSCDIDAAGRQQAMANISRALEADPNIDASKYIRDGYGPQGTFNSPDYCTYMIRPWQPVITELIWDGTLAFRINKQSFEVEDYRQVDE
jgi:hypothetical protein